MVIHPRVVPLSTLFPGRLLVYGLELIPGVSVAIEENGRSNSLILVRSLSAVYHGSSKVIGTVHRGVDLAYPNTTT